MNRNIVLITLVAFATSVPAAAQEDASDTPPRPMAASEDPVNRMVAAATVPGLIVSLKIDGNTIALERAQPARIPKPRDRAATGDTVTVTGISGARAVASVTAADPLMVAVEEGGVVRAEQRTIDVALPTPSAIDTIEVRLSATGATARLDVRAAYAEICRALPRDPVCEDKAEPQPR